MKRLLLSLLLSLAVSVVFAQSRTVSGTVTDESGEALTGVTVLVQGTSKGTTTDIDGKYSLSLAAGEDVLVFSFVSYISQSKTVGNQTVIDVQMAPDTKMLDELVVTGYSSQSKRDISGSVAIVDAGQLTELPVTGLDAALQGRVAGVTVGTGGGPGGSAAVRIRGFGTLGNNDPLYVIDGVPTTGGMNEINPNDIESVQVLKDAASSSIYGSRAANGVIVITTKKGKGDGSVSITFDSYVGTQNATNLPNLMNTSQWMNTFWEGKKNAGQTPSSQQFGSGSTPVAPTYIFPSGASSVNESTYNVVSNPITKANASGTNWMKEIFKPATIQNYQIGATGGTEKGSFALSASYFGQEGTMIHTKFDRYTLRANTEFRVKDRIRLGENFTVAYSERTGAANQDVDNGPMAQAYRMSPIIPVYDIRGNFAGNKGNDLGNAGNPVATLWRNKDNKYRLIKAFGNVFAEVEIIEGLTAKSSIGIEYTAHHYSGFTYRNNEAAEPISANSFAENTSYAGSWTWSNTLNYELTMDEHRLTALAGVEAINSTYRYFGASRASFFVNDLAYRYLNSGTSAIANDGYGSTSSLYSIFGQANYSLKDRYMLTGIIRRDGSSRFGANNRFGIFPSVSAGWRVSEEAFMQNVTFISNMKVRASWGQTGNQQIGDFPWADFFGTNLAFSSYDIAGTNSTLVPGYDKTINGNPDIKWETTTQINFGLDMGMLGDKLNLSLDIYDRKTEGMLIGLRQPLTGPNAGDPVVNIGSMKNTGLDLQISYDDELDFGLKYSVAANFSTYKNEVISVGDNKEAFFVGGTARNLVPTRSQPGQPISSFYGATVVGIDTQEGSPTYGGFKFKDADGDGNADQGYIGSPHPDFTYGLNLRLEYKNFDLTVFAQGTQGNKIFNFNKWFTHFPSFVGNRSTDVLNAWSRSNTGGTLPQYNENLQPHNTQSSTFFVEDGSYLRVKNVSLGYTLPSATIAKTGLKNLKFYVQAQNLLTLTGYSGMDPEINLQSYYNSNRNLDIGVDRGAYPNSRNFLIGVKAAF